MLRAVEIILKEVYMNRERAIRGIRYFFIFVAGLLFFGVTGCGGKQRMESDSQLSSTQISPKPIKTQEIIQTLQKNYTPMPSSTTPSLKPKEVLAEGKNTKIETKKMRICIDPGHQQKGDFGKESLAPDSNILKIKTSSGAEGIISKIPEDVINLRVSEKLKDSLKSKGFEVIMTRESQGVNLSNIERAKIANDAQVDLCLRIHADSSTSPSAKGISVLIPAEKYIKDVGLLEMSKKAGALILNKTIQRTAAISRGLVAREDITGFNWSKVPVVLIEMGFLSNKEEDRLLNSEVYQKKIVEGITQGVEVYFSENAK